MKNITILTATRAEYGLLKPIIEKLGQQRDFKVRVVVTGTHLSPEFGMTYREIEEDGIEIDEKIEILLSADTPSAVSKTMGMAMISFADYFGRKKPDMLVILGDRYESLAVASVAMNYRIPIAHIHGGETTEGLIDESIRHSLTKMSYLHFTSTEEYRKRVIQLGERPERVFNFGAIGVENIKKNDYMDKNEFLNTMGLSSSKPYAVVTFHPVTLENQTSKSQVLELFKVITEKSDINYIFTKSNADMEGQTINDMIDEFAKKRDNCISVSSLGVKKYLTALKYSHLIIGNSSSGILEAPSFKIPTINIGDRQKGRIQAESVINSNTDYESIIGAFNKANDIEFRKKLKMVINPYEKSNTCENIVLTIKKFLVENNIKIKKAFYDIKYLEE